MINMDGIMKVYLGGNNSFITESLSELPVVTASAEDGILHLVMSRPLTASEAFVLGTLGAENESIEDDQIIFDLMFD